MSEVMFPSTMMSTCSNGNIALPMANYKMNRRDHLKEFIRAYRDLPELWDLRNKCYSVQKMRSAAYDKLLVVYKKFDKNATVEDVRRKIHIIRTGFRKQLRRFNKNPSTSSWLFGELGFLLESEVPSLGTRTSMDDVVITFASDTEEEIQESSYAVNNSKKRKLIENGPVQESVTFDVVDEEVASYTDEEIQDFIYTVDNSKKSKLLIENEHARERLTFDFLDDEVYMTKIWASKLKSLEPDQKLFAEKAINDILFESKLGTLHRHSVQINQHD